MWIDDLGAILEGQLSWLLAQFVREGSTFAAGLAFLLISIAIAIVAIQGLFRVAPTWIALSIRCSAIKSALKGAKSPEDCRQHFASRFSDQIDPALSGHFRTPFGRTISHVLRLTGVERSLQLAWSELKETFIDESESEVIKNTARPHGYVMRAVNNPAQLAWLSGFFVSVGLFFTFVGIIAVLGVSADAMGAPSHSPEASSAAPQGIDEIQDAIIQIVAGASSKFYASVGGILAAILLRFMTSLYATLIKQRAEQFSDLLESGLAFVPEQRLIQYQLEQLIEQTVQLKKFNTDLAVAVGDRFDQAMAPVAASLGEIKSSFEEQSQRTMQVLGEGVGEAINNMAGGEIRALGHVLSDLKQELSGMSSKLSEGGDVAAEQLKQAATQLRAVSESFQGQFDEMASRLSTLSQEQASQVTEALAQLASTSQSASEGLSQGVTETVQKLSRSLDETIGKLDSAGDRNASSLERMAAELNGLTAEVGSKAREEMSQALSIAADDSRKAAAEAADTMRQAYSEASENWVAALDESLSRLDSLKAGFDQADRSVRTHAEAISQAAAGTTTAADAMGRSARDLESVAKPIATATTQLENAASSVRTSVEELTRQASEATTSAKSLVEELLATSEAASDAWDAYQERFEGVDEDLEKVLSQMSAALDQNAKRLTEYVSQVDGQLAAAVENLSGVVRPLTDLADELEAAIGKIQSRASD